MTTSHKILYVFLQPFLAPFAEYFFEWKKETKNMKHILH
jgi:hypothetical protein